MEREVKLKVDDRDRLVEKLKSMGAEVKGHKEQVDYYLDYADNHLKNNGLSLRVRDEDDGCFITFKGQPLPDELKLREELETRVENCNVMFEILERVGMMRKIVVKKQRDMYLVNGILVQVDIVEGLGDFMEIEIKGRIKLDDVKKLIKELNVKWAPIKQGYADMLASS